ncbi:MAG: hypothetical protein FI695_01535 [SAR202 cluster bacterium]|nr:hypothetical protein [SAR202 cluster bacterium]|tara:strand:- start:6753 stop:7412 length:660 start_codon:yes stop_codon:yes gene_type:complete
MIFEETKFDIKSNKADLFLDFIKKDYVPNILKNNIKPICLLRGMIGKPASEFILISAYHDINAWEKYTHLPSLMNEKIVYKENNLLKPISNNKLMSYENNTLKNIYGYREFIIETKNVNTFVESSEKGIWPRVQSQGGRVLGLWSNITNSSQTRILLLTGYDSVSHWEGTRSANQYGLSFANAPEASKELTETEKLLRKNREDITISTTVNLMQNINLI